MRLFGITWCCWAVGLKFKAGCRGRVLYVMRAPWQFHLNSHMHTHKCVCMCVFARKCKFCNHTWLLVGCRYVCVSACLRLSGAVYSSLSPCSWPHDTSSSLADTICILMKWNFVPPSVPDRWQFSPDPYGAKILPTQTDYLYWSTPLHMILCIHYSGYKVSLCM